MSCPCLRANPIPLCAETLYVGTIGTLNLPVTVAFTNIATGRVDCIEAISDDTGSIIVELDDFEINDQTNYKIQIYSGTDITGEALTVTVDDTSDSCIYFTGKKFNGVDVVDAEISTLNNDTQPTALNPFYHFTTVDYSVPSYITAVGVGTSGGAVHIYLTDPTIYGLGEEITVSDEVGMASTYQVIVHGPFALGNPQTITADYGSITFYRGENDEFIVTATN